MRQGGCSRSQHHPLEVLRQCYPVSSFLWHFPGGQKLCFWVEANITWHPGFLFDMAVKHWHCNQLGKGQLLHTRKIKI